MVRVVHLEDSSEYLLSSSSSFLAAAPRRLAWCCCCFRFVILVLLLNACRKEEKANSQDEKDAKQHGPFEPVGTAVYGYQCGNHRRSNHGDDLGMIEFQGHWMA
jgi:hypothetical protein